MKLEEYLKAIEECSDELLNAGTPRWRWRLTAELGIYDNWTIYLNANYDEVVGDFLKSMESNDFFSGKYRRKHELKRSDGRMTMNVFEYVPGTVELGVGNYLFGRAIVDTSKLRDFNMAIVLWPYQEKKIEGVNWVRALAIVISDIGKYAQKKKLPICFPCSIGWDEPRDFSKDSKDYLRIVYYEPEK